MIYVRFLMKLFWKLSLHIGRVKIEYVSTLRVLHQCYFKHPYSV